jgi:enterochelin esterase-like enzyme
MTRLLCGLLLTAAVFALEAQDASAQARTVRHTSAALGAERIFAVLLPTGYADSTTRYPVVYLFHGGGQDHTAFMARTMFLPMARRHGFIVVMPAADRNYSSLSAAGQAKYHEYVASELVDYVDANYRTIASPESRAIAGLSMGGRIATMTALQFPQRFGTVGAFSAAVRGDVDGAVEHAAGSSTYFYVSCGTLDGLLTANQRFVEQLAARKIPHEYHEIVGGEHAWNVWDPEIGAFFDLLSKRIPAPAQSQR